MKIKYIPWPNKDYFKTKLDSWLEFQIRMYKANLLIGKSWKIRVQNRRVLKE